MKSTLTFVLFFCSVALSAQDLNCLKSELYSKYDDLDFVVYTVDTKDETYQKLLKPDSLQIIVLPGNYVDFSVYSTKKRNGVNKGFKVLIVNNSPDDFDAFHIDKQIVFFRQVFYNHQWITLKPIVKDDFVFCGNSVFGKKLVHPGQMLTYAAPCYEGTLKAKFRLAVTNRKNVASPIYSNEFESYLDERLVKN